MTREIFFSLVRPDALDRQMNSSSLSSDMSSHADILGISGARDLVLPNTGFLEDDSRSSGVVLSPRISLFLLILAVFLYASGCVPGVSETNTRSFTALSAAPATSSTIANATGEFVGNYLVNPLA